MVATQSAGNSDPSNVLSATPRAPLAPPTNIVAFGGNGQVKLSWTPDPSGISVNVLRGAVPGGPYPIAVASNATSTSVVDNVGITNGTLYYYVLQSVGATSTSGDSVEVSAHAQRELCVATPDYAAYSFDADAPSGFVLPNRVFGDQTRVVTPLDVAYDPVHAELWETDQVGSVVAFSSTADGNAAPLRIIGGAIAHLGIGIAGGLAVDPALGEVYVGAIYEIVTFSRTAHGQVAPLRSFTPFASTAISGVVGLSYDATNHELWTIDTSNATVKGFSRTAAGTPASPATPLRSITNQGIYGYSDGWAPAGVLVDPAHDELLVVYGNAVATSPALFVVYDRYLYGTDGRNDQPIKRWFVVPAVTGANPQPALITDLGLALAYDPAADEYIVATGSSVSALARTSGLQPSNPMVPFPDAAGTGQPPAPDTTGPYAGSTNYPTAARSRPYLGGTGTFGAHIGSGNAVAVDVANRLVFTAGTPRLQTGGLATFQLAGGSAIRRIIGTQSGSQFGFLGIDLVNGELWSGWEYPTGISAWSLGAASVPTPARTLVAAEITSDRAGVLGIAFNEAAGELYASSGWGIAPAGAEPPQVLTYLRTSSGTTSAVGTPVTTTAGSALFFDAANQELWVANGPGCTANVANCAPPASTTPPQLSAYSRTPAGVGNFSSTPLRTIISAGIGAPGAITVAGNSVFVTNSTNGHVLSFSRTGTGTLSPATEIIQKPAACNPFVTRGLHVDAQGNLFVADLGPGNSTCIAVYHSSDSGPAVVPQRELQLIGASQPQSLAPCN